MQPHWIENTQWHWRNHIGSRTHSQGVWLALDREHNHTVVLSGAMLEEFFIQPPGTEAANPTLPGGNVEMVWDSAVACTMGCKKAVEHMNMRINCRRVQYIQNRNEFGWTSTRQKAAEAISQGFSLWYVDQQNAAKLIPELVGLLYESPSRTSLSFPSPRRVVLSSSPTMRVLGSSRSHHVLTSVLTGRQTLHISA